MIPELIDTAEGHTIFDHLILILESTAFNLDVYFQKFIENIFVKSHRKRAVVKIILFE